MKHSVPRPRADAPTVILHWLLVAALATSLATGFRIAADAPDAMLARLLSPTVFQGKVILWHVTSAIALLALAAAYAVFIWHARLSARVRPTLAEMAAREREHRWRAVNRTIYWLGFVIIAAAGTTGAMLYLPPAWLPRTVTATIHHALAWAILGYVGLHLVAQIGLGGARQLLKIVTPRLAYGGSAAVALLGAAVAVAAVVYPLDRTTTQTLRLARVTEAPTIDGDTTDAAWRLVKPIEILTTNGANLVDGKVTVRVRAVRDGDRAYFLFEWPDATRSQKHLPLLKTAQGWRVIENEYAIQDEDDYYEDKFAMMLSRSPEVAGGGATHLGPKPLPGKPGAPGGRGLHYTTDKSYVDVWHWKSVRTNPLKQVDDNHFGPPLPAPTKPGQRYTGGYTQDPKSGGSGFDQNWEAIPGSPFVRPKRLPRDLSTMLTQLGPVNLDPSVGDDGQWWLDVKQTEPYSETLDAGIPVGTVMPSVLIGDPFEGDRGDVTAVGTWKNGWWRLEASRQLGTRSQFDLPIATGSYLWVAVFDHTQTRHSRHLHPVRLELE